MIHEHQRGGIWGEDSGPMTDSSCTHHLCALRHLWGSSNSPGAPSRARATEICKESSVTWWGPQLYGGNHTEARNSNRKWQVHGWWDAEKSLRGHRGSH